LVGFFTELKELLTIIAIGWIFHRIKKKELLTIIVIGWIFHRIKKRIANDQLRLVGFFTELKKELLTIIVIG